MRRGRRVYLEICSNHRPRLISAKRGIERHREIKSEYRGTYLPIYLPTYRPTDKPTGGLIARRGGYEKGGTTGDRPRALPSRTFVTVRDYTRPRYTALHLDERAARATGGRKGRGKRKRKRRRRWRWTYVGSSPVLHGRLHLLSVRCGAPRRHASHTACAVRCTGRYNFLTEAGPRVLSSPPFPQHRTDRIPDLGRRN